MSDKTYDTTIVKFANDGNGNLKLSGLYENDISAACDKVTTVPDSFPALGKIKDNGEIEVDKEADLKDAVSKLKSENEDNFNAIGFNDAGEEDEDEKEEKSTEEPKPKEEKSTEEKPTEEKPIGKMNMMDELKAKLNSRNEAATARKPDETTEPGDDEEGSEFKDVPDYSEIKSKWDDFLQGKIEKAKKTFQKTKITELKNEIKETKDADGLKKALQKYTDKNVITDKYKLADDFSPPSEDKAFLFGGRKTLRNMKYKLKRTQNKRSNKRRTKKYNK
jgi:hypothetical protein